MSLSGALVTAVTGLGAQSNALGAISDNIANSQTTGYKGVNTDFQTLLTVSNATVHQSGGVTTTPLYTNDLQGTITQTGTETNVAVSGSGYFAVNAVQTISTAGVPTFTADPLYTRAGDFSINSNGYLVNSSGYYLSGWNVNPNNGIVAKNQLVPIQINQLEANPQATQNITYSANIPANPTNPTALSPTTVNFYDAQGNSHQLTVSWAPLQTAAGPPPTYSNDTYSATISTTDPTLGGSSTNPVQVGSADVQFNLTNSAVGVNPPYSAGSIKSISNVTSSGGVSIASPSAIIGSPSTIPLSISLPGASGATPTTTTTGAAIASGTTSIPLASVTGITSGSPVTIAGAGAGGAALNTTITGVYSGGSTTTSAAVASGATSIPLSSIAGLQVGSTVTIAGAGAGGTNLTTTVSAINTTTNTITIGTPTSAAVATADSVTISPMITTVAATATATASGQAVSVAGMTQQAISLNLGTYGTAQQTTLFTGGDVNFISAQQDGLAPGSFSSLTINAQGLVTLNYNNGALKTDYEIPLVNFSNFNGLQPVSGNAYTATTASGNPQVSSAGSNGTGNIVPSSIEGSNVDISTEFALLIQTQQAYDANSKVLTTANQMLQTIDQVIP